MMRIAWLAKIGADRRYTTWPEDITHGGEEYESGSRLEVSGISLSLDSNPPACSLSLSIGSEAERAWWLPDPGRLPASVVMLWDDGDGNGWREGPKVEGVLNRPSMSDTTVSVLVEPVLLGDRVLEPVGWSAETQRARYPGDRGFDQAREAEQAAASGYGWIV